MLRWLNYNVSYWILFLSIAFSSATTGTRTCDPDSLTIIKSEGRLEKSIHGAVALVEEFEDSLIVDVSIHHKKNIDASSIRLLYTTDDIVWSLSSWISLRVDSIHYEFIGKTFQARKISIYSDRIGNLSEDIDVTIRGCTLDGRVQTNFTQVTENTIQDNVTWTEENSPYVINSSVTIDGSLTLVGAVDVVFSSPNASLLLQGDLTVQGNEGPIKFMGSTPLSYFSAGFWDGITVLGEKAELTNVLIAGANTGLTFKGKRFRMEESSILSTQTGLVFENVQEIFLEDVTSGRNQIGVKVSGTGVLLDVNRCDFVATSSSETAFHFDVVENLEFRILDSHVINMSKVFRFGSVAKGLEIKLERVAFVNNEEVEIIGEIKKLKIKTSVFVKNSKMTIVDTTSHGFGSFVLKRNQFVGKSQLLNINWPTFSKAELSHNMFFGFDTIDNPLVLIVTTKPSNVKFIANVFTMPFANPQRQQTLVKLNKPSKGRALEITDSFCIYNRSGTVCYPDNESLQNNININIVNSTIHQFTHPGEPSSGGLFGGGTKPLSVPSLNIQISNSRVQNADWSKLNDSNFQERLRENMERITNKVQMAMERLENKLTNRSKRSATTTTSSNHIISNSSSLGTSSPDSISTVHNISNTVPDSISNSTDSSVENSTTPSGQERIVTHLPEAINTSLINSTPATFGSTTFTPNVTNPEVESTSTTIRGRVLEALNTSSELPVSEPSSPSTPITDTNAVPTRTLGSTRVTTVSTSNDTRPRMLGTEQTTEPFSTTSISPKVPVPMEQPFSSTTKMSRTNFSSELSSPSTPITDSNVVPTRTLGSTRVTTIPTSNDTRPRMLGTEQATEPFPTTSISPKVPVPMEQPSTKMSRNPRPSHKPSRRIIRRTTPVPIKEGKELGTQGTAEFTSDSTTQPQSTVTSKSVWGGLDLSGFFPKAPQSTPSSKDSSTPPSGSVTTLNPFGRMVASKIPRPRGRAMPIIALKPILLNGSSVFSEHGFISGILKTRNTSYLVSKNLTVPGKEILQLEPGVVLEFVENTSLTVQGRLIAFGNSTSRIVFTSKSKWGGLKITDRSTRKRRAENDDVEDVLTLSFLTISNAREGLVVNSTLPINITDLRVSSCDTGVSLLSTSNIDVSNLTVLNCSLHGALIRSTDEPVTVRNASILLNQGTGLNVEAGAGETITLEGLEIRQNAFGMNLTTSGDLRVKDAVLSSNQFGGFDLNLDDGTTVLSRCNFTKNGYGLRITSRSGSLKIKESAFANNSREDIWFKPTSESVAKLRITSTSFDRTGSIGNATNCLCIGCEGNRTDGTVELELNNVVMTNIKGTGLNVSEGLIKLKLSHVEVEGLNGTALMVLTPPENLEVLVNRCTLKNNTGRLFYVGVDEESRGTFEITRSNFFNNTGDDLVTINSTEANSHLQVTITANNFTNNRGLSGLQFINVSSLVINRNNFCNPEVQCELQAPEMSENIGDLIILDARENFWCKKNVSEILDRVCDFTIDAKLAKFDLWPAWTDGDLLRDDLKIDGKDLKGLLGSNLEDHFETVVKIGEVHNITRSIYVPEFGKLKIQPGVELNFAANRGILVKGELILNGTKERPVKFRSMTNATWRGLTFLSTSDDDFFRQPTEIKISNLILENAELAIEIIGSPTRFSINNTIIRQSRDGAVWIKGLCSVDFANNSFLQNEGQVIRIIGQEFLRHSTSLVFRNNTFKDSEEGAVSVFTNNKTSELNLKFTDNLMENVGSEEVAVTFNLTGNFTTINVSDNKWTNNSKGGLALHFGFGNSVIVSNNAFTNSSPCLEYEGFAKFVEFFKNSFKSNNVSRNQSVSHMNLTSALNTSVVVRDNVFVNNSGGSVLTVESECPDNSDKRTKVLRNVFNNSNAHNGVLTLVGSCFDVTFNKFDNNASESDLMVIYPKNDTKKVNATRNWWTWGAKIRDRFEHPSKGRGRTNFSPQLSGDRNHCMQFLDCSGNGRCLENDTCLCNEGWTTEDCTMPSCSKFQGCSGHGHCLLPQVCECDAGWFSPDCLNANCSALSNCSKNGECIEPNRCLCNENFTGSDCSTCVPGRFGPGCNPCGKCKHGDCDIKTGKCNCKTGFSGENCDHCAETFFGHECKPIMRVISVSPNSGFYPEVKTVVVRGHNFPNSTNYYCKFGTFLESGRWQSFEEIKCNVPKNLDQGKHLVKVRAQDKTFTSDKVSYDFLGSRSGAGSRVMGSIALLMFTYFGRYLLL